MFQSKLKALDYLDWDKVNGNDPQHIRKLVPWLEDQKIRHYKIEDRKDLQNIQSSNWDNTFQKYCNDVGCPLMNETLGKVEWLISLAVRLDYEDNCDKYINVTGGNVKNDSAPNIKSKNPLDNLDFQSNDFKNGVREIAKLLNVPQHPNHLLTLEACSKLITKRLNPTAVQNPSSVIIKGQPFPVMESSPGFDMGDKVLSNGAKGLNLLYIQNLRDLQTQINEAIVSVQNITANPKTDTRLGKVGRM